MKKILVILVILTVSITSNAIEPKPVRNRCATTTSEHGHQWWLHALWVAAINSR